jgi:cytolysin (calcineurin-like family phosphatase)
MKTSQLIALTATIVACAAATASARPAVESPGNSQASKPSAVTPASIAAHREQISNEQWQRSQAQPAAEPLTDRSGLDDGLPLGLVLVAVTVPLGLLIFAIGKPVLSYGRHRRHPTSAA